MPGREALRLGTTVTVVNVAAIGRRRSTSRERWRRRGFVRDSRTPDAQCKRLDMIEVPGITAPSGLTAKITKRTLLSVVSLGGSDFEGVVKTVGPGVDDAATSRRSSSRVNGHVSVSV